MTGSFSPFITKTGTLIVLPTCCSWSIAAGRWTSSPKSATFLPRLVKNFANLPQVVVFPEPKSPTRIILLGSLLPNTSSDFSPPRNRVSSSYTMLTRCSRLVSAPGVCSFVILSFIFCVSEKTSLTLTSLCKSERWMSLTSSLMSFSSTKSELAIFCKVFFSPSESFSKTIELPYFDAL